MPAVIEGVDLVALAAILLLIGLLTAVKYTFVYMSVALDISILGVRPFKSIGNAIESTVIKGCNAGIAALGSVAHDLWAGSQWMLDQLAQAIMAIPNGVHAALDYLWKHAMPAYVKAAIGDAHTAINGLGAKLDFWSTELAHEVTRLDAKITATANATLSTAEGEFTRAVAEVQHLVNGQLTSIRTELLNDLGSSVASAEATGASAVEALRKAEQAAVDAVSDAQTATADELRDLVGNIPLSDLTGIIASIPLLASVVQTLEAESGLENSSCRAKVKGICGTDPLQWAKLLEGLALLGVGLSLEEVFKLAGEYAGTVIGEIEAVAKG